MRENAIVFVRYLFSFDFIMGENFSQHNNVVLLRIYSRNRWQGTQRQGQALSMEWINGTFNNQSGNHNSQQQANRTP